jgi:hypothetical protein
LKYEKLEIKELRLDLVDPRHEREEAKHEHEGPHHRKKHIGAIRRLGEEIEALGRRLASASGERDDDKD